MKEQIRISPVRVVGANGEVLGVLATAEALKIAVEAGLELVQVAPNVRLPVCKIMDSGKFTAQQNRSPDFWGGSVVTARGRSL